MDTHATLSIRQARAGAFLDVRKLVDKDGNPLPLQDLDADTAAAIESIESFDIWEDSGEDRVLVRTITQYRFIDRLACIETLLQRLLPQHFGQAGPTDAGSPQAKRSCRRKGA